MRLATLVLMSLVAAPALSAQSPAGENPRDAQVRMLENQRKLLLSMVDSMPEQHYRDRATPGQRDFAQQIHHAASAAVFISTRAMGGERPTLPDTATAFNSRAGLRQFVSASFDHMAALLKNQSASSRAEMFSLFGQQMPKWQVWDEIHTHTIWTAGQVVANFRKHGMAPPPFAFF
jgi:hypothetical protein